MIRQRGNSLCVRLSVAAALQLSELRQRTKKEHR